MERLVCLLIGYIFGLFQTGYFYGKTQGVDIRKMGSGNAGSTNALRTMGIKAGMITLLGDCFKCVIAVLVVRGIYGQSHADILPLLSLYTGFGAVLGHNFPFYLKFKGGKGIAVTAGISQTSDIRTVTDKCRENKKCSDSIHFKQILLRHSKHSHLSVNDESDKEQYGNHQRSQ